MDRTAVMNSEILKKRFCKDCRIPITVYENPYFYDRLKILDSVYGCIKKFEDFCNEMEYYRNEQEYLEHYNSLKDKIINDIKSKKSFNDFIAASYEAESDCAFKELYSPCNDGKAFISVDMKKANFTALKYYSKDIFDCANTWEDYIGNFTDDTHFIESKYIRQVIMGACNPKKQTQYEKYLMAKMLNHLESVLPGINVYSLSSDEIIISVEKGCPFSMKKFREAVATCPDGIGDLVRVEIFNLEQIKGTEGWIKYFYNDTIEFKCLSSEIIHQVVKYYYNKPIEWSDLVFVHNGMLAAYLKGIDNPWQK